MTRIVQRRICIYCASSALTPTRFVDHARELARILVRERIDLVFGGSRSGLMGALADEMMAGGGKAIGVMPRFMTEVEWNHPGLSELILTDTMAERKEMMIERVDAVITLPGGCGTMEEFMETLSLKRLGRFTKPMIILNSFGFYDPLVSLLDAMLENKFLGTRHGDMWQVVHEPGEILPAIESAPEWEDDARSFALVQ